MKYTLWLLQLYLDYICPRSRFRFRQCSELVLSNEKGLILLLILMMGCGTSKSVLVIPLQGDSGQIRYAAMRLECVLVRYLLSSHMVAILQYILLSCCILRIDEENLYTTRTQGALHPVQQDMYRPKRDCELLLLL